MSFESTFSIVLSILTIAAVLSLIAVAFGFISRQRYPSIEHACWMIVLLRMVMPPLVPLAVPWFPVRTVVQDPAEDSAEHSVDFTVEYAVGQVDPTADILTDEDASANLDADSIVAETDRADVRPMTIAPVLSAAGKPPTNIETPESSLAFAPAELPEIQTDSSPVNVAESTQSGTKWRPRVGSMLVWIWIAGSVFLLIRASLAMWRFHRLMRLSEPVSPEIQAAAGRVAQHVGLRQTPTIRSLRARIPPLVWTRLGSAFVVLPREFSAVANPTQRELVLAHEFAHLKRRDHLLRWLELFAFVLWWWCPLTWLARSRMRQAEESACDAWVLRIWPERSVLYANVIVATVGFVAGQRQPNPMATGGIGSLRRVGRRVKEIQLNRASAGTGPAGAVGLLLLALVACPLMLVGQSVVPGESVAAQVIEPADAETSRDETAGPPTLPPQFDPLYSELSPDNQRIAFVGTRVRDDGTKQFGLFSYDSGRKETTCLIEKALKTRPAWSPDSTKIAIGNSPGYGNLYPLVIVDATTGEIDETGVQGAGAAWSPDGRYVAVSTDFGNAGSWSAGIPCDGRIGVWDTVTRKLSDVSPQGINETTRDRRLSFMSGGVNPKWSASGQWIAWQQRVASRRDGQRDSKSQVWIARRDGSGLVQAFKESKSFQWDDADDVLIDLDTNAKVDAEELSATANVWPAVPQEFKQRREQDSAAAERATQFDAQRLLQANRLWQDPPLQGIDSVEFTHRMSPNRLDEHFVWRKDGTSLVQVTRRDDQPRAYGVGWSVLRKSDGARFTSADEAAPPRYRSPEEITKQNARKRLTAKELLRRETLRHLSGTRLNFAAIDWGRNPTDYAVSDFKVADAGRTVELRPQSSAYRRAILNAGAMFETTSWSYLHDVRYDRAVLTIDQHDRIIREETYAKGKRIAEIELLDWVEVEQGQAPLRIVLSFPENNGFVVDQRFRVTDEGLWILKSGTSKFAESTAQREEIVDLRLNQSVERLTQRLEKLEAQRRELDATNGDATTASISGLTPLELGATHQFRNSVSGPSSLTLLPHDTSRDDRGWPKSVLCAELRYPHRDPARANRPNLMIALYDDKKLPLYVTTIPESAISMSHRTAADILGLLLEKHRLWLRGATDALPVTSYTFRVADRETKVQLPSTRRADARGMAISFGLDAVRAAPEAFALPVAFTADWNGKVVNVLGLTGPDFKQEFGSGIDGTFVGGYSSSQTTSMLVIVDAQTGFPLVERTESMEFQFLDYAEAAPGQFVPLRVLCKTASLEMDVRFQVIDGKLWLADHKVQPEGGTAADVSVVRIEGQPPISQLKSEAPEGDGSVDWFQWNELINRVPQSPTDQLSASVAAVAQPWIHPLWDLLRGLSVQSTPGGGRLVRVQLDPWPYVGDPAYWTLTSLTGSSAQPLLCPERVTGKASAAPAYVSALGPSPIRVSASKAEKTRLKTFRVQRESGRLTTLTAEILSTSYYTDQRIRVTAVALNQEGIAVAGGWHADSRRTYGQPVVSQFTPVSLLNSEIYPTHSILLGCRTDVTGGPMGSTWGRRMITEPEFSSKLLLSSRYAQVRLAGLRQLYRNQWHDINRHFERRRDDNRLTQAFAPYRADLARIVSATNGDSDEAIAIACRLAGYSRDPEFIEPLRRLLNHESSRVRDGATIGLGLLGVQDQTRLQNLINKASTAASTHPLDINTPTEAAWASR